MAQNGDIWAQLQYRDKYRQTLVLASTKNASSYDNSDESRARMTTLMNRQLV